MPEFSRGTPECKRTGWRPPPDVMSCDEIRAWLTYLLPTWGSKLLTRTLCLKGVQTGATATASGKRKIFPTEQIRMSATLRRIIAGELIPQRGKVGIHTPGRAIAVLHNPQPLVGPLRTRFDMKTGRIVYERDPRFPL